MKNLMRDCNFIIIDTSIMKLDCETKSHQHNDNDSPDDTLSNIEGG